jgi:phage terminase large subunit-like protein
LLERDAVPAELRGLARRAPAGQGRVVLRRGEAGAGKTAAIARWVAGLAATYALKPRGL